MNNNDDDIQLQSYQDDLTIDDGTTDPLMEEEGDDPTRELGIPADEFSDELSKEDDEDRSSLIEDYDDDPDDKDY